MKVTGFRGFREFRFLGRPVSKGCHETPHRLHRPQIQRYLTLDKQQE